MSQNTIVITFRELVIVSNFLHNRKYTSLSVIQLYTRDSHGKHNQRRDQTMVRYTGRRFQYSPIALRADSKRNPLDCDTLRL